MDEIKQLIETNRLSLDRIGEIARGKRESVQLFRYNPEFDALTILLVPPTTETIAHYVDDHVALLYLPESFEIVGFRVEAFEHSFLPSHTKIQNTWRLSDACKDFEDVGDLLIAVQEIEPNITREVAKVAESILGHSSSQTRRVPVTV